jgi:serine/threonine protein kinase
MNPRASCQHAAHVTIDGLCAVCLLQPSAADYTILTILGRGPQTTSYIGRRMASPAVVVAKIGHGSVDGAPMIQRIHEATERVTAARIPNVSPVMAVGILEGGRPYVVRPFVDGACLTTFCQRSRADRRARRQWLAAAEQVMTEAHDAGIAHGHLTPANILVQGSPSTVTVTVTDFGISPGTPDADRTAMTHLASMLL